MSGLTKRKSWSLSCLYVERIRWNMVILSDNSLLFWLVMITWESPRKLRPLNPSERKEKQPRWANSVSPYGVPNTLTEERRSVDPWLCKEPGKSPQMHALGRGYFTVLPAGAQAHPCNQHLRLKQRTQGWSDSSGVETAHCSCRGHA